MAEWIWRVYDVQGMKERSRTSSSDVGIVKYNFYWTRGYARPLGEIVTL